jgi:hypothetical protein
MHTSIHSGRTGNHPASPHAVVYGLYVLSPEIGLCCLRRLRKLPSNRLDASVEASGPYDFAVRVSAARQEHIRVHRIPPRVRDDRDTPLQVGRDGVDMRVIWVGRKREYFWLWGWTAATTPNLARRAGFFGATSSIHASSSLRGAIGCANARPTTGSPTKQSTISLRSDGLLRFARNDVKFTACSPDGAQRNPEPAGEARALSRISLRSIRATGSKP